MYKAVAKAWADIELQVEKIFSIISRYERVLK